jgi:hypothetical protein
VLVVAAAAAGFPAAVAEPEEEFLRALVVWVELKLLLWLVLWLFSLILPSPLIIFFFVGFGLGCRGFPSSSSIPLWLASKVHPP